MNEIVTLLNLTLFIYNFYTWPVVMFFFVFFSPSVNALYLNGKSPRQIPAYI